MSRLVPIENTSQPSFRQGATPDKYIDLADYLNVIDEPDNREELIKTYGSQLISGPLSFLSLMGATQKDGTADQVTYWEEARLHKVQDGTIAVTAASESGAKTITTVEDHTIVDGDVVMINGYIRARALSTGAKTYTVTPLKANWGKAFSANEFVKVHKVGNEFAQGTGQPTNYPLSNVVRRTQPYMIMKYTHVVKGSAMGNIGWVKDPDTGSKYWFQKGLSDQKKRAQNYHESMALFAVNIENSAITALNLNGSEGYVDAIEDRGIVNVGYLQDLSELQDMSVIQDKQKAPEEFMFGSNRVQGNLFDNMTARAIGQPAYGMFQNREDMAVNLGFKSVKVGGRTFHNKVLEVLTDPTFGGQTDYYKFFMSPYGTVTDPKTSIQAPMLELNYKTYEGGRRRYMEHWMEGGVDGTYTNDKDSRTYHWRSEYNLVTRGANRHVIGRG